MVSPCLVAPATSKSKSGTVSAFRLWEAMPTRIVPKDRRQYNSDMESVKTLQSDALPRLLTIDELATHLQIPRSTIYVWRTQGLGPAGIRIGRHLRWRQEDVELWLEERKQRAGSA